MKSYQPYFEFIRYAMGREMNVVPRLTGEEWEQLFLFADEQAIAGVVFEGVRKMMESESEGLSYDLMVEWATWAVQIEDQNKTLNRKCVEVMRELEGAGFQCCILKGQGNTINYLNPLSRMSGDIDVLIRNADRKKLMHWVKERKEVKGIRFHHVEYEEDELPVELHFVACSMNNPVYNHRLQKWFREHADREDIWNHRVMLPDTEGEVSVPTIGFNVVYQLVHMMHHFFDEGIGLRQMMDYYYVLRKEQGASGKEQELRYLGLWKFAGAVMWVMKEVFDLEDEYMIAPVDERRGKTLLNEILKGGNFGQHSGLTEHSTAGKYFAKHWRNLHFATLYPEEALCEPFFRTWHFFWRLGH